jgi:hypothetical protein
MNNRLMQWTTTAACHVFVPLVLAVAGFGVLAAMTHRLQPALAGALVGGGIAYYTASRYALVAIGPRFADWDFPPTWSFVGSRVYRLLQFLIVTPAVVLVVYYLTAPFSNNGLTIAVLAAAPTQLAIHFLLERDALDWSRRVRRGRIVQSQREVHDKLLAYTASNPVVPAECFPWAGMMVPRELMAPHTKLFGMTGSGKTVSIRIMLQWLVARCVIAKNTKLVVFDPKRELYSYILGMNPQVPVILLDATDRRGVAWDIASDIDDPNQAKAVAKLLVPDENSSQPYFFRSARRILECVIRFLILFAHHWDLQDVFMILNDLSLLRRILPDAIVAKYFQPETTLKNTLSTLDTLTSRFETVAACWAHAEREGHIMSLKEFEAARSGAILVIPRRLDIADAVDPTIRLIFERLIHLWLSRPDVRFLSTEERPETYVLLDETAKAGSLAHLDDLLLMGRAKGVSVILAAQDIEAMRQEYGQKVADSLLAQCGNTAVFALESPETCEYYASIFGTHEARERHRTAEGKHIGEVLKLHPEDLYRPGELREHKNLLASEFSNLPRPADTGQISGYFITGGMGAHTAAYPFADALTPPANVPVLVPRDASEQEFPEKLTPADLKRLGIPENGPPRPSSHKRPAPTKPSQTATKDSLRFIDRITGD